MELRDDVDRAVTSVASKSGSVPAYVRYVEILSCARASGMAASLCMRCMRNKCSVSTKQHISLVSGAPCQHNTFVSENKFHQLPSTCDLACFVCAWMRV